MIIFTMQKHFLALLIEDIRLQEGSWRLTTLALYTEVGPRPEGSVGASEASMYDVRLLSCSSIHAIGDGLTGLMFLLSYYLKFD